MGWFLSSKSSGAKKKRKTSRGAKAQGWDPQRTLMGLKLVGVAAVGVAVVLAWTATEQVLGRYAADARSAAVTVESVKLVDAPAWVDDTLYEELRARVAHSVNASPFDARGLRDAAATLNDDKECPWIARVDQVRRSPGGVVRVHATYRRPAALVEDTNRSLAHVVDDEGVWLDGPIDRASSRWSHLPLITGVSAAAPPTYGKKWPGSDITAALALEHVLHEEIFADQITAYDVSHRDLKGRLWLVLYTDGPAIVWGLPPGEERSVEPESPIKLAALRDWAYKHRGRINVRGAADTVWVYTGTAQIDARPSPADPTGTVSASRR
ncbi:MAG: hypothetical protein AAGH99_15880 [Planctomycetota bacterium]